MHRPSHPAKSGGRCDGHSNSHLCPSATTRRRLAHQQRQLQDGDNNCRRRCPCSLLEVSSSTRGRQHCRKSVESLTFSFPILLECVGKEGSFGFGLGLSVDPQRRSRRRTPTAEWRAAHTCGCEGNLDERWRLETVSSAIALCRVDEKKACSFSCLLCAENEGFDLFRSFWMAVHPRIRGGFVLKIESWLSAQNGAGAKQRKPRAGRRPNKNQQPNPTSLDEGGGVGAAVKVPVTQSLLSTSCMPGSAQFPAQLDAQHYNRLYLLVRLLCKVLFSAAQMDSNYTKRKSSYPTITLSCRVFLLVSPGVCGVWIRGVCESVCGQNFARGSAESNNHIRGSQVSIPV